MSSSTANNAPIFCADEYCTSLLISAAVALIRLERIDAGIVCASTPRVVAEARNVLEAIQGALACMPLGANDTGLLKTARDLLQAYLPDATCA